MQTLPQTLLLPHMNKNYYSQPPYAQTINSLVCVRLFEVRCNLKGEYVGRENSEAEKR